MRDTESRALLGPVEPPPLVPGSLAARTLFELWRTDTVITLLHAVETDPLDEIPTVVIAHLVGRAGMWLHAETDRADTLDEMTAAITRTGTTLRRRTQGSFAPFIAEAREAVGRTADWGTDMHTADFFPVAAERSVQVVRGRRGVWIRTVQNEIEHDPERLFDVPLDVVLAASADGHVGASR